LYYRLAAYRPSGRGMLGDSITGGDRSLHLRSTGRGLCFNTCQVLLSSIVIRVTAWYPPSDMLDYVKLISHFLSNSIVGMTACYACSIVPSNCTSGATHKESPSHHSSSMTCTWVCSCFLLSHQPMHSHTQSPGHAWSPVLL